MYAKITRPLSFLWGGGFSQSTLIFRVFISLILMFLLLGTVSTQAIDRRKAMTNASRAENRRFAAARV